MSKDLFTLQSESQDWIEQITGEGFAGETWADSLKDGIILCKLANALKPNSIPKYNTNPNIPHKKMENISFFLKAIRSFGMKEFEMFGTNDLFDEKNLKQVCSSIHALGRLMQTPQWSHLAIPKLGIKVVEKNERVFTEEQKVQARMAVSVLNLGSSNMGRQAFQNVLSGQGFNAANLNVNGAADGSGAKSSSSSAAANNSSGGLPAGWEELKTDDGTPYYYNSATNVTSWEKPAGSAAAAKKSSSASSSSSSAMPAGWEKLLTADGTPYYYNSSTNETSWELPKGGSGGGLPSGWQELATDDGTPYFYNSETNVTSWERPT